MILIPILWKLEILRGYIDWDALEQISSADADYPSELYIVRVSISRKESEHELKQEFQTEEKGNFAIQKFRNTKREIHKCFRNGVKRLKKR